MWHTVTKNKYGKGILNSPRQLNEMSAIKIANINLGCDGKMEDHVDNTTFVLKLVSGSFRIQKCNLRSTSFSVAYFELWENRVSFFPNMIAVTYWFQYEWRV